MRFAMNPTMPAHPYTNQTAIGFRRDGRPIWPVMGGDGTTEPPPADPPKPTDPPTGAPSTGGPPADPAKPGDEPLGDGGKKALEAERMARKSAEDGKKALEAQLAELAPLAELVTAIRGGKGVPDKDKTEIDKLTERVAAAEKTADDERIARWRSEVALTKKLTPGQAARLVGASKEELESDADALVALFPPAPPGTPGTPGTPAPDLSQGARGGQGQPDLEAQIKEAQAKGDVKRVIALQNQKLGNTT
jgi:hypothetical protein